MKIEVDCPICRDGKYKYNKLHVIGGLQVVQCRKCGLVLFNPNADYHERKAFHTKEFFIAPSPDQIRGYPDYLEPGHVRAKYEWGTLIKTWFERIFKGQPRSILELGCAFGHMLKPFSDAKWKVLGLDISDYSIQEGKKIHNFDLRTTHIDDISVEEVGKFDCFMLWDSLEHYQYPNSVLAKCAELATDNAVMIVHMPDVTQFLRDEHHSLWSPYQHCVLYSAETLGILLNRHGWRWWRNDINKARREPAPQPKEMLLWIERVPQ